MKGLKETEVLCSEGLFRLLSPSMDIVSVTVFRLAPNTFWGTASSLAISVRVCVLVHRSCSAIAANWTVSTGTRRQQTVIRTSSTLF